MRRRVNGRAGLGSHWNWRAGCLALPGCVGDVTGVTVNRGRDRDEDYSAVDARRIEGHRRRAMPITVGVQGLEGVPDMAVLVGMLGLIACFVGLVSILWSVNHPSR